LMMVVSSHDMALVPLTELREDKNIIR